MTEKTELSEGQILFTTWLDNLHGGEHSVSATNALATLVEAIKTYGGKGKLTLTIDAEPATDDREMLYITVNVDVKAPKAPARKAVLFVDDQSNLVPNDPHRVQLPFRDLEPRNEMP